MQHRCSKTNLRDSIKRRPKRDTSMHSSLEFNIIMVCHEFIVSCYGLFGAAIVEQRLSYYCCPEFSKIITLLCKLLMFKFFLWMCGAFAFSVLFCITVLIKVIFCFNCCCPEFNKLPVPPRCCAFCCSCCSCSSSCCGSVILLLIEFCSVLLSFLA